MIIKIDYSNPKHSTYYKVDAKNKLYYQDNTWSGLTLTQSQLSNIKSGNTIVFDGGKASLTDRFMSGGSTMEKRTKLGLSRDKMYKALGEGERTSKKVSTIRMSDGSSFKRRNANKYGMAEGGNDYTEKRSNRSDKFDNGGGTGVSSQTGYAEGTNAELLMNKDYLAYKNGGEVRDNDAKRYKRGGEVEGMELMGGQPNSSKPSGYFLLEVKNKGKEIIVSDDGGKTKERYIKNNGFSGYTIHYKGNKYEFTDSYANGGGLANTPESFPSNDAMSYKTGGEVGNKTIKKRLEELRQAIRDENISYGELAELKSLVKHIDKGDVELLEAAGVDEQDLAQYGMPIAICNRTGSFVYPTEVEGYYGYCPELDEDLYKMETTPLMALGGSTKSFEYTIGGL